MKSLKCLFCSVFIALEYYLQKNNKNQQYQSKFFGAYNVFFYYSYINQKRKKELLNILTINGFSVKQAI